MFFGKTMLRGSKSRYGNYIRTGFFQNQPSRSLSPARIAFAVSIMGV